MPIDRTPLARSRVMGGGLLIAAMVLSTTAPASAQASSQPSTSPEVGASSRPAAAASQPSGAASQPAVVASPSATPPQSGESKKTPPASTSNPPPTTAPSPKVWRSTVTAASVTNRPGASETSSVLPQGGMLLQTGLDFASNGALNGNTFSETRSATVPDLTLRIGVLDFLELRAGAKYSIATDIQAGTTTAALGGYRLGAHLGVTEESQWVPAMALSLGVDVPLPSFAYDEIGGEARLAWSKGFFDTFGVGGNFAAGWDGVGGGNPYLAWTVNMTGALSDTVTPFVELFGDYTPLPGYLPTVWVDGGLQWAVTDWLALDAALGVNLFGAGLSYFTSVGASFFFPGHMMIFGGSK